MSPFGFGKNKTLILEKPEKKKKQISPEDERKKWAHKKVIEMSVDNPEMERWYVATLLGIKLPENMSSDPLERVRKQALADMMINDPEFREKIKQEELSRANSKTTEEQMNDIISKAALTAISTNPELLTQAVTKKISSLIAPEKNGGNRSKFGDLLDYASDLEELKDVLGANSGGGKLITPEVLQTIIASFPSILGALTGKDSNSNGHQQKTYVVETVDGKIVQLTPQEFKTYLESKQPIASLGIGKEIKKSDIESKPIHLGLDRWMEFIDSEPQVFYDDMQDKMNNTNYSEDERKQSKFVFGFLKIYTAEKLLEFLQTYKTKNEQWKGWIEQLENHKKWLQDVIDLCNGKIPNKQSIIGDENNGTSV